jgi:hypothetical protein
VKDAVSGKQSAVFTKGANHSAPVDRCMSVISKTRTLDLQADTSPLRDTFVTAIRRCINECKVPTCLDIFVHITLLSHHIYFANLSLNRIDSCMAIDNIYVLFGGSVVEV